MKTKKMMFFHKNLILSFFYIYQTSALMGSQKWNERNLKFTR